MHNHVYGRERGVKHPYLAGIACIAGALVMLYVSLYFNSGCIPAENPNQRIEEKKEKDNRDDIRDTSRERVAFRELENRF